MPGIESYRREEPSGSFSLPPTKCASLLFTTLIEGAEETVLYPQSLHVRTFRGFDPRAFERLRFVYLAANVAVLLAVFAKKDVAVTEVIAPLRELVRGTMRERWQDTDDTSDDAIEKASEAYATLVFTDPAANRALSLEWSQEWLRQVGVTDHDLVAWMQLSRAWKDYHLHSLKFVSCLFE